MSGTRSRQWEAAGISKHYTLTLSSGSVFSTPQLEPGLYEVQVEGGSAFVAVGPAAVAAIPTGDGDPVAWVRGGWGIWVHLPEDGESPHRFIAAKREGSSTVTIHVQKRG